MKSLLSLFASSRIDSLPSLSFSEARKRARILVLDDDPDSFPIELLKTEGYNIHYWEKVRNLKDLEQGDFDLIVLDIHGIATGLAKRDGLDILEHIKKYNPAQIVIAYSAKKYDLNQGKFWRLTDDFLGKPATSLECKQKIDDLIQTRFSKEHYWTVLRSELQKVDVTEKAIRKLEKELVSAAKSGKTIETERISRILGVTKDIASIVGTIIGTIIKLATL